VSVNPWLMPGQWLTSDLAAQTGITFESEADLTRALDEPWNGITLDSTQRLGFEYYDLAVDVDVRLRWASTHFHDSSWAEG
jgi:hypothetical protein